MARSYVKLSGPPIIKGLMALEKVAIEINKELEETVRFYNILTPNLPSIIDLPVDRSGEWERRVEEWGAHVLRDYSITTEEKVKMISRATDTLGDWDFFFEWGKEPSKEEVLKLISKIDEALAECGCKYTITTK